MNLAKGAFMRLHRLAAGHPKRSGADNAAFLAWGEAKALPQRERRHCLPRIVLGGLPLSGERMIAPLAKFIDWSRIQARCRRKPSMDRQTLRLEEAVQFLNGPDFIPAESRAGASRFRPRRLGTALPLSHAATVRLRGEQCRLWPALPLCGALAGKAGDHSAAWWWRRLPRSSVRISVVRPPLQSGGIQCGDVGVALPLSTPSAPGWDCDGTAGLLADGGDGGAGGCRNSRVDRVAVGEKVVPPWRCGAFDGRLAGGIDGVPRCAPGGGRSGRARCAQQSLVRGTDHLAWLSGGTGRGSAGVCDS